MSDQSAIEVIERAEPVPTSSRDAQIDAILLLDLPHTRFAGAARVPDMILLAIIKTLRVRIPAQSDFPTAAPELRAPAPTSPTSSITAPASVDSLPAAFSSPPARH